MNDFNLIVTTHRFAEEKAEDEILELLENFGDSEAVSEITNVTGLIECRTALDPFKVVAMLIKNVQEEPWAIRYLLRVVPIEKVVNASLDEVADAASNLSAKMTEGDSFRITVEKRHTVLQSKSIISSIAARVKNDVDLDQPDWIILVEIVGGDVGVSVLKQSEIFSSVIEKRR